MKVCTKCKENRDIGQFTDIKRNGRIYKQSWCKSCIYAYRRERRANNPEFREKMNRNSLRHYHSLDAYGKSLITMARGIYCRGLRSVGTYAEVENRIGNTTAIKAFLHENFEDAIRAILDRGGVPSIDRVNPEGHYEPSNIHVIPLEANNMSNRNSLGKNHRLLLCKEFIEENPEMSIADLGDALGVNERTTRKYLKELGY